jgi:hypothetical protein
MREYKPLLVTLLLLLLVNVTNAQLTYAFKKSKYFQKFQTLDLAVELSGNESFDKKLRASVEEVWSGKKEIVYVTSEELADVSGNEYAILGVVRITKSFSGDYGSGVISKQTGYGLYIPTSKSFGSYLYNVLAYVPFTCYSGGGQSFKNESECNYAEEIGYKIDLINHIIYQLIDEVGDSRKRGYSPPKFMNHYNWVHRKERFELLEKKVLLVNKADLSEKFNEKDFEKMFRYEVEFAEDEDYKRILNSGSDKYVVLLSSQNTQFNLSMIDLESKKLLGVQYGVAQGLGSDKGTSLHKKQIKMLQKRKIISNELRNKSIVYGLIGFTLIGNALA